MSDAAIPEKANGVVVPVEKDPELGKPLTEREVEILGLLASGFTGEEVGQKLGIAGSSVGGHAMRIRGKLGARNIASAVAIAMARGYIVMADSAATQEGGAA